MQEKRIFFFIFLRIAYFSMLRLRSSLPLRYHYGDFNLMLSRFLLDKSTRKKKCDSPFDYHTRAPSRT